MMCITEYDEELHLANERQLGVQEGIQEGLRQGEEERKELEKTIEKLTDQLQKLGVNPK